jgi:hypothetical protein
MASKNVTSHAGHQIEIVDDADWIAATNCTEKNIRSWHGKTGGKPLVIMELWLGGEVQDKSGRASGVLIEAIERRFGEWSPDSKKFISQMMRHPMNAPAFQRETNGKRTYSIRLVAMPETWYRKMLEDIRELERRRPKDKVPPIDQVERVSTNGVAGGMSNATLEEFAPDIDLDAPTVFDVKPPLELSVASQVAMSLLTTVVEIITAGSADSVDTRIRKLQDDMNDVAGKLSLRLSENDTLRRQVRESGGHDHCPSHRTGWVAITVEGNRIEFASCIAGRCSSCDQRGDYASGGFHHEGRTIHEER